MNGYGGPAEYAMQQEQQQRQNIQNIINMFLQYRQYQQERELRERDRQYKMGQDVKQNEFEERRTKSYEDAVARQGVPKPEKPVKPEMTPAEKMLWSLREYKGKKIIDSKVGAKETPKQTKPSAADKKLAELVVLRDAGKITPEQYNQAALGITPPKPTVSSEGDELLGGGLQMKDEFGYTIGEVRKKGGISWEYIGGNKWSKK